MQTINNNIGRLPVEKGLPWLLTLAIMIFGWPILKSGIIFILEKLYQFFIGHTIGK